MRLFSRRKEVEFDDPRLLGMASLKQGEERRQTRHQQQEEGMPTLTEEEAPGSTMRRTQQPDKCKMTNGVEYRIPSRPWNSLKKMDPSEHVSRSVMSARRKTLHFFPDLEEDGKRRGESSMPESTKPSASSQIRIETGTNRGAPPRRKIGRVESLRLLLSKSNRIYRGKNAGSKQDKGTDTQDLNNDNNDMEHFQPFRHEQYSNDELLLSKYSSISSLRSDAFFYPLSSMNQFYSQCSLNRTTSCENLAIQNYTNQGKTLPGYRDSSTSTITVLDSSSLTQSSAINAKRASFPYAYIRSKLGSLQEEQPKKSPAKPPRTSIIQKCHNKDTHCSVVSTSLLHKGLFHSMGNLTRTSSKEDDDSSPVDCDDEHDDHTVDDEGERTLDPLKQIRIDLLLRNPSEIDDQQNPSPPTCWGRRSYSIGDVREKRKIEKSDSGNSTAVEESGYDSDSTRNGHESPQNSVVQTPSICDTETAEAEQCAIKEDAVINGKLCSSSEETGSLDSQLASNGSEISSGSSSSTYSFPPSSSGASLIRINQAPPTRITCTNRTPSVNGFRKGEDGSIIEVTSEIDQSENIDLYSVEREGNMELLGLNLPVISRNAMKPATQNFVSNEDLEKPNGEKSILLVERNKEDVLTPSIKKETNESQSKTAPSLRIRNRIRDRDREGNSIKSVRPKSVCLSIFTVTFHKGPGKKSLGFSIIGGKDSPVPGIFVKRVFPYGQASEDGNLSEADQILSFNGQPLANFSHTGAINLFRSVKNGEIVLEVARREFLANTSLKRQYSQVSSKSCEQLHQAY